RSSARLPIFVEKFAQLYGKAPGWEPMVRSTVSDPVAGSGLAREPTTLSVESAAKSLLGAAPLGGLFPPPYPPPPPQAASPNTEESIAEITSSLRFGIMLFLSTKVGRRAHPGQHTRLTARAAAPFRRAREEDKQSLIRHRSQRSCNKR